jgi:serine/threonine protein kinase
MSQTVSRYRLGQRLTSDALTGTHEGFARDERGQEQKFMVRIASLPDDLGTELFDRFRAEAKSAAALSHECIVPLLEHGVDAKRPYVVHPFTEAISLRALLAKSENKKLPPPLVGLIGLEAARGLEHAHRREPPIIHGGISPDALVVDPDGRTRIGDFALVNLLTAASNSHSQLLEHTCRYHSPEQAKHRPLTSATDLFSLGATLYEALTGKPAFFAPTPLAIVLKISMASHDRLDKVAPDVPAPLRQLVTKMLSADPAQRPSDDEVITVLEKLVGRPDPLRSDLGLRVKPQSERAAAAPVLPVKPRVDEEEEEENEGPWGGAGGDTFRGPGGESFPAFNEISGESTQIESSGMLLSPLAAAPPPRVGAAASGDLASTEPMPKATRPRPAQRPAERTDDRTDPPPPESTALLEMDAHTHETEAAPPWGVEKTALLDTSNVHGLRDDEERDTNPPPPPDDAGPFAPQPTVVMVANLHARPPPMSIPSHAFDTREPEQPDTKRQILIGGWPLPIVVGLGVGAMMVMIFLALMIVWVAS